MFEHHLSEWLIYVIRGCPKGCHIELSRNVSIIQNSDNQQSFDNSVRQANYTLSSG